MGSCLWEERAGVRTQRRTEGNGNRRVLTVWIQKWADASVLWSGAKTILIFLSPVGTSVSSLETRPSSCPRMPADAFLFLPTIWGSFFSLWNPAIYIWAFCAELAPWNRLGLTPRWFSLTHGLQPAHRRYPRVASASSGRIRTIHKQQQSRLQSESLANQSLTFHILLVDLRY